jgi:hypothetical protein
MNGEQKKTMKLCPRFGVPSTTQDYKRHRSGWPHSTEKKAKATIKNWGEYIADGKR